MTGFLVEGNETRWQRDGHVTWAQRWVGGRGSQPRNRGQLAPPEAGRGFPCSPRRTSLALSLIPWLRVSQAAWRAPVPAHPPGQCLLGSWREPQERKGLQAGAEEQEEGCLGRWLIPDALGTSHPVT